MLNCNTINLTKGSNGETVKELQTILKNKGYYTGKIDGYYGDLTIQAVKLLQRQQGNSEDGQFGPKTCRKLNQNINNNTTHTTPTNNTNPVGKKFLLDDLITARKTFRKHIKNNNNYPNYITIPDNTGKKYDVLKADYMGIFEAMHMFAIRNGRLPNWVIHNTTANNPLVIDYQNNGYNCGPTSLSMCLQMFADYISEPTLAKYAGTNRNGTGPADLKRTAKHYGYGMTEIGRNSKAVQDSLSKCRPVLMHIHTSYAGGRSCLGYRGAYGHYIMCYGMRNGRYLIADPTKGFKVCNPVAIDNARSSSNMKYYSISIL